MPRLITPTFRPTADICPEAFWKMTMSCMVTDKPASTRPHAQVNTHGAVFLVCREYRKPAKGLLFRSARQDAAARAKTRKRRMKLRIFSAAMVFAVAAGV